MKIALTIAGSDPTGGAGLQADLRTFKSMGVYGLSVPSALTVQDTSGVLDIHEVPADFFSAQLDTILKDIYPHAIKTGMLYSPDSIRIVAQKIKWYSLKNLVIDPVTVSSTGVSLLKEDALEVMRDYLFPLARVITPNVYEAQLLTGINIEGEKDMKDVAVRLRDFGPEVAIVTGGHLHGGAADILWDGEGFLTLKSERVGGGYHGTGCVFSSAITASLALGYDVKESALRAKEFVLNAIRSAISPGKGMKVLNN